VTSLSRRLRGSREPEPITVAHTAELRLAEVLITPTGVIIDVEVRASTLLPAGLPAWGEAEVRLGIHWMGADGGAIVWDGPRSETVPLQWLELTPFRRTIALPSPPAGATELRVELVAEGIAWGEALGLAPLRFPAPGFEHLTPAAMELRPRGPQPPAEAPPVTRAWLSAGWPQNANPQEMANYVGADLARFLMSVQVMPEEPGRILEVGSNPYFISRLVQQRFPECELRMTNYFGVPGDAIEQDIVDAAGAVLTRFCSELVDTEIARLPYDDASFDTVLLCEVIEHLIKDPVFQLAEIARVLRPGGVFILTTPNVARAGNRHRLAQRQGIYDPYSGYGPHGRHNREYTAEELFDLVTGIGFAPITYLTRPVHGVADPDAEWFRAADDDGSGDYHFLVMRRNRSDATDPVRPGWLYR
jgi:SAM-dependent methyltransferase